MDFDQWSIRQRAFFVNVLIAVPVVITFTSSDVRRWRELSVPLALISVVFLNFMLLLVRPRIVTARATGTTIPVWRAIADVFRQRSFFVVLLVMIQLFWVSWLMIGALNLPSAADRRIMRANGELARVYWWRAESMVVVAGAILIAIGLWHRKRWAWWSAFVLSGFAIIAGFILPLLPSPIPLRPHLDFKAIIEFVVLLLPSVGRQFSILSKKPGLIWRGLFGFLLFLIILAVTILNFMRRNDVDSWVEGPMRTLATAETTYANFDPSHGYVCLQELVSAGLIDNVLGSGTKNGYRFVITDCEGRLPHKTYTIMAYPLQPSRGKHTYCAKSPAPDEAGDGVIHVADPGASLETCLQSRAVR